MPSLRWPPLAALLAVAACIAGDRPAPVGPDFAISDGAHSGGTPGFFFLPPLVSKPAVTGLFDADIATVNPAIAICDVTDGPDVDCGGATPALRSFTVTSTPAIVVDGEKYKVDWDTKEGDFAAGRTYRVHVLGGTGPNQRELGFADVLLTTEPGKVKNLANNETIVLNDGRTLPIHVRIEVGVIVPPGPAVSFELTGLPASLVAGTAAPLTVTARDEQGQVATGYRGTVTFTSSDPQAVLPTDYAFTEGDAGSHVFSDVSFKTAGAVTLRVADAADANLFGEAAVTVEPAAAATLDLTGLVDAAAGTAQTLTVTARDAFGNVATGYTGTIAFISSDEQAILPGEYTFAAADAGTHAFADVVLRTAGSVTVTATDTDVAAVTGSQTVTIAPAAAATLVVSGLTDGATAGIAQTLTVTARDASGNRATGYTGTIAFTSSDAHAVLPEPYTFTAEDAGTRSFSGVELRTAGTQNVTATDQAVATITGGHTVTVVAAAAAELILAGLPDPATAGVANDVTVTARDAFGNTATGYTGTVQFSSSDPNAVLTAPYPFQSSDAGVHTFTGGVSFKTAGEHSLTAGDGTITATVAVIVEPAAAAAQRFTTQPSDAPEDTPIAPPVVVTAYDAFDNVATGFTGHVTIAIGTNPGPGTLSGTLQVTAALGVGSFGDLSIDQAGFAYTLVASASGLTGVTSDPFDVTAVAPTEAHWINAAGGAWSVGSNWSTGTPPTAEQNAFIDLDGTYTVTLDVDATVNQLTLGASSGVQTLTAGSGRALTLSTSGTILSTGRMLLTSATVSGTGILTNAAGGTLSLSQTSTVNTALVNAGTLAAGVPPFSSSSTLNGAFTTVAGSLVRVHAGGSNSATLTVANGFTNHGTIELTKATDQFGEARLTVTSGTLVNASDGTIRTLVGSGGGRTLAAQLDNQGTVILDHLLTINRGSADHTNSGLIQVSGGNLTLTQSGTTPSFTNTRTITVAAGRTWAISGGSFTQASDATLDGGGAMSLTSVNPAVFGTAFTLGALSLTSTTASFATDITTQTMALSLSTSTINGSGTLTNAAGRVVTLQLANTINMAVVNAGTLQLGVGNFSSSSSITGAFTTVAGSLVRVQAGQSNSSTLAVTNSFTNHGTIELTKAVDQFGASTLAVSNGTLVNAPDGTINSVVGTGGGRTLTAQLDNQGAVNVLHPLTINGGSADHTNSGTIAVSGGNLAVSQSGTTPSFTNTGTVTVAAGRTWAISGGSFTQDAGATLDGGGAMTLTNVNPAAFGSAFTIGVLTLNSTTASFATDISTEATALSLTNATVNGPGTVTNAAGRTVSLSQTSTINTALVNAGTLAAGVPPFFSTSTINGTFTTVAGSLVRVQAGGSNSATLTVASGFTNHGTIELTKAGDNVGEARLVVGSGTLVNASDGTMRSVLGSGGGRVLAAQLDNRGTVTLDHVFAINRGSATHTSSGTIRLNTGDLTVTQSGTSPSFTNAGLIDLVGPGAMRLSGGGFTNDASGSIQGGGTFETGTTTAFSNAGSVIANLVRIGNTLTGSGSFAPVTAEFFGSASSIPAAANYTYTHVRVLSSATFAGSKEIPGNLTVAGAGNLTIGGHEILVEGNFATQNTAVLTMQTAVGRLNVRGNVSFGGGSTNTRLTAGQLWVGGNFTQSGGSPAAFAASTFHRTELDGATEQLVFFANPGSATTASHFQGLTITNFEGVIVLNSAVFANGQLSTPVPQARVIRSAGLLLTVAGLSFEEMVFDGTPLRVVNGAPITRFDNNIFRNMDPTVTQFRLDRLADIVTFNNIQFLTAPTSGVYLHLVDTDLAAPLFTVTMAGTQPPNHGGKVVESVAGQLLGWPF